MVSYDLSLGCTRRPKSFECQVLIKRPTVFQSRSIQRTNILNNFSISTVALFIIFSKKKYFEIRNLQYVLRIVRCFYLIYSGVIELREQLTTPTKKRRKLYFYRIGTDVLSLCFNVFFVSICRSSVVSLMTCHEKITRKFIVKIDLDTQIRVIAVSGYNHAHLSTNWNLRVQHR